MEACWCDYDPPEFWQRSQPLAKREHKCEECGCTIRPGERYERVAGKWDGYFDTFKTCERCLRLREWMTISFPCFCWAHGSMRDDAREVVSENWHHERGIWVGWGRLEVAIRKRAQADFRRNYQSAVRGEAT